jgi:hypothetical protein
MGAKKKSHDVQDKYMRFQSIQSDREKLVQKKLEINEKDRK